MQIPEDSHKTNDFDDGGDATSLKHTTTNNCLIKTVGNKQTTLSREATMDVEGSVAIDQDAEWT